MVVWSKSHHRSQNDSEPMTEQEKLAITEALAAIIADIWPDAGTSPKYGGQMIFTRADDPLSCIGGYFVYSGHVSLEFSQGAQLVNSPTVLEGTGKHRRHIKLKCLDDVQKRGCKNFLVRAAEIAA